MKYLLHGGRVVTMNARREILDADILTDGDHIAALGVDIASLPEAQGAEQVDMSGRVLLPGLIQAHMHTTQILSRGLCDDLELMDWLDSPGELLCALALGYPGESPAPRPRRELSQLVEWRTGEQPSSLPGASKGYL